MKIYYCEQFPEEISQHRLAYLLLERALGENWPDLGQTESGGDADPVAVKGLAENVCKKYRYGRTDLGKPYLADYPQIQFNLSHCRDCVACAVDDLPVGIDVEKRFPWKENLAKRICHPLEWELLMKMADGTDRAACLNLIWSRKESYLKCIGTGIRRDLREFQAWTGAALEEKTGSKIGRPERESIWIEEEKYCFLEFQTRDYTLVCCAQEGKSDDAAIRTAVRKVEWQDLCVR